MSKETVNTIETQGNSADTILEQIEAVRAMLDVIEEKIDPAPAMYPDTFDQMQIFVAPYVKRSTEFYRECLAFRSKIDDFMMDWRRMRTSIPTNGNYAAWSKTLDELTTGFDEMAHGTLAQVSGLGSFSRFLCHMAAMACNCDEEHMRTVLQECEGGSHE